MKRTISIELECSKEKVTPLVDTGQLFAKACNLIATFAAENRCWNKHDLHHLCYYSVRDSFPALGSQMVCSAIKKVCGAYKALKIQKNQEVPKMCFKEGSSIHYDKRTYSLKGEVLSLFTVKGRIQCRLKPGNFQTAYLEKGMPKEGELIQKEGRWFFNLVLDIPDPVPLKEGGLLAVDVGENNLAATSNGTLNGGGKLRHKRDKFLARRRKLQSNGSKSAKRKLKRISGRERRHVKETNHIVSKAIVEEAVKSGAKIIVMENLTHIRKRIKGNKRMRSRLHRWSWSELQEFVEYKAQACGISILYVNPAYTSQTCSKCLSLGSRHKHRFKCSNCGRYQHSDRNAAVNLLRLGESVVLSMAFVNMPMVAEGRPLVTIGVRKTSRSPFPPNRTCSFPAYGSPVNSFHTGTDTLPHWLYVFP